MLYCQDRLTPSQPSAGPGLQRLVVTSELEVFSRQIPEYDAIGIQGAVTGGRAPGIGIRRSHRERYGWRPGWGIGRQSVAIETISLSPAYNRHPYPLLSLAAV